MAIPSGYHSSRRRLTSRQTSRIRPWIGTSFAVSMQPHAREASSCRCSSTTPQPTRPYPGSIPITRNAIGSCRSTDLRIRFALMPGSLSGGGDFVTGEEEALYCSQARFTPGFCVPRALPSPCYRKKIRRIPSAGGAQVSPAGWTPGTMGPTYHPPISWYTRWTSFPTGSPCIP